MLPTAEENGQWAGLDLPLPEGFGMPLSLSELEPGLRIALALLLGAIVGFERERAARPAGLRTHMMVAAGAAIFTVAGVYGFPGSDSSRIAAQVVTGIGFLGAGTILRTESGVRGLTTAAGIWFVAAVGVMAGAGLYLLSLLSTLVVVGLMTLLRGPEKAIEQRYARRASEEQADEQD